MEAKMATALSGSFSLLSRDLAAEMEMGAAAAAEKNRRRAAAEEKDAIFGGQRREVRAKTSA